MGEAQYFFYTTNRMLDVNSDFVRQWETALRPWNSLDCTQDFLWGDTGRPIGNWQNVRRNPGRQVIRVSTWDRCYGTKIEPVVAEEIWDCCALCPNPPKPVKKFLEPLRKRVAALKSAVTKSFIGGFANQFTNTLAALSHDTLTRFFHIAYVDMTTWAPRGVTFIVSPEDQAFAVGTLCLGDDGVLVSIKYWEKSPIYILRPELAKPTSENAEFVFPNNVKDPVKKYFVSAPGQGFFTCVVYEHGRVARVCGPWDPKLGPLTGPLPVLLSADLSLTTIVEWPFSRIGMTMYTCVMRTSIVCFSRASSLRLAWILACVVPFAPRSL